MTHRLDLQTDFERRRGLGHITITMLTVALALLGGCSLAPPATSPEITDFVQTIANDAATASVPFSGVLTAEAAVERAIELNQEVEAARLEVEIADATARIERGELLPDLMVNGEYYHRDKAHLSQSSRSNLYSTSSDLTTITRNLDLSLNVLDFGLTLVRMRQAGDKANQKYEALRRVAHEIAERARSTYWRAVALQRLAPELDRLSPQIEDALRLARAAARDPALTPTEFINFQRDLLNERREINDVLASLAGAQYDLMQLTSIPSDSIVVLDGDRQRQAIRLPDSAAADDIHLALSSRPEIRDQLYQKRITDQDVTAAVLNVLPGAVLTRTFTSDSTSYLLYGDWMSWSARATSDLVNLIRLPEKLEAIGHRQAFNRQSAIVTATAIATEVLVARARVGVQASVYRDAEQLYLNHKELLRQVRNAVRAGRLPEQAIVREELSTLLAEVRAILAFGDVQATHARYLTALGSELRPAVMARNE